MCGHKIAEIQWRNIRGKNLSWRSCLLSSVCLPCYDNRSSDHFVCFLPSSLYFKILSVFHASNEAIKVAVFTAILRTLSFFLCKSSFYVHLLFLSHKVNLPVIPQIKNLTMERGILIFVFIIWKVALTTLWLLCI